MKNKRSNTNGVLKKKKTGNDSGSTLTKSPSTPNLLKKRKPLIKISRGMLKNMLPKGLANNITGNVSRDIFTLAAPDKSYDSIFWKDNQGPKMFISLVKNHGTETSDNILNDLEQVLENKDQDILPQDNPLPSTIIIDTEREKTKDAQDLVKQLLLDFNAENEQGKTFEINKIAETRLTNNTVGLNFSITEKTNLKKQTQTENDDDDPDVIIIQPKNLKAEENGEQQDANQKENLNVRIDQNQPKPIPVVNKPQPVIDSDADLRKEVKLVPIKSVEQFKNETRETTLGRDNKRTQEYENMVKSLETYHNDLNNYEREALVIKNEITKIGQEKIRLVKSLTELQKENKQLLMSELAADSLISINLTDLKQKREDLKSMQDEKSRSQLEGDISQLERDTQNSIDKLSKNRKERESRKIEKEIVALNQDIGQLDSTLEKHMILSRQVIRRYRNAMDDHAKTLTQNAQTYLNLKSLSNNNSKKVAVQQLIGQVADPDQHLERIKEVSRKVWNADFQNQLAKPTQLLNSGTASEVFLVETNGNIGATGNRFGFAKKAIQKGEMSNDTTANLGMPVSAIDGTLTQNPNLIARQVISSRLAKELGLEVIADEVFSSDSDGNTMGITGKAPGKQLMKNVALPLAMHGDPSKNNQKIDDTAQIHSHFNFKDPRIQKNLSDLQVMDALTGQLDRHLGNIFVDETTGKITGIDNDMAFAIDSPLTITGNTLELFKKENGQLVFVQEQIDSDTAKNILALNEKSLREILRGKESDPEHLENDAIDHAVTRLTAIQNKIQELQIANKLIGGANNPNQWGDPTFNVAIANGTAEKFGGEVDLNYLARAKKGYDKAGLGINPLKLQEAQGV